MMKLQMTALMAASVLSLAACAKDDARSDTTTDTTVGDAETGEAEGDGDGDGDGDPTTTTGDGDGDPTGFVPDGDMAAANTCDPWAQDCPEGEKCAAWAMGDTWDSNKCVPVQGTGQTGDECQYDGAALGTDDCDVGHMCYYTNADGLGSCIPLCTGSPDAGMCPDGFNCSISNDGSLLLCVYSCDPILQDCEAEGTGCFWDGVTFNCDPAGTILEGEPCGYINDCSPGMLCADAAALPACAGSACCAAFCDLSQPACGIAGTECIAFFEEGTAPPGLENVGVCTLPG